MEMKKSFLMVLAAAALVGCAKSEGDPVNAGDVKITLRSDVVDASGVVSRVPFIGPIGDANPLDTRVIASLSSNFAGAPYANGTMTFKSNLSASYNETNVGAFEENNQVYVYGLYPKNTWDVANANNPNGLIFTGKEDVMASGAVLLTKASVAAGPPYTTLQFKHLLTRLRVKLSGAAKALTVVDRVTAISLVGATDGVQVDDKVNLTYTNVGAPSVTFSSSSATSLPFYALGSFNGSNYTNDAIDVLANTLSDEGQFVGYSLVGAVDASDSAKEYYLKITTGGGDKKIAVDLVKTDGTPFVGSTAGRSFIVSVYFKSNEQITANAEVLGYEEGGEWEGELVVE
jgi:hypothetical protein